MSKVLRGFPALCLAGLAACTSVGTQYKAPLEGEPFAQLQKTSHGTVIMNFDEKGCYAGQTDVADGARLRAGEEVVIRSMASTRIGTMDATCTVVWGLTPRAGARYGMRFKLDARYRVEFVGGRCVADLFELAPDGSELPAPARALRLSIRRVGCIRVEPVK